jgi:hypothetical protein
MMAKDFIFYQIRYLLLTLKLYTMKRFILRIAFIAIAMIAFTAVSNASTIYMKIHIDDNCGSSDAYYIRLCIVHSSIDLCQYESYTLVAGDNYISYNCDIPSDNSCSYTVKVFGCCEYDPYSMPSLTCCIYNYSVPQCFTFGQLMDSNYYVAFTVTL